VVIDVDPRHGGNTWLSENQNRLPSTLTHRTPRGGEHLAFRVPPDVEIRNSQGRIAPGVDVRGTGGYVIVPPSEGYTIKHNGQLADMPQWLIEACLKPQQPPPPPPRPRHSPLAGDGAPYGLKALSEECIAIHTAPFGQQEITLNNAALKIGSLVAAGQLAESYALTELIAAGNAMPSESGREPWRVAEIAKKIKRALADGKRTPRKVPPPLFADDQDQPQQQRDAGDAADPPAAGARLPSPGDGSKPSASDDAELERLARLPPIEYGRARKPAAKRLGVPVGILHRAVADKRAELGLDKNDDLQGHALDLWAPPPWPDPVEGGGAAR
jgi:hypothetical protein